MKLKRLSIEYRSSTNVGCLNQAEIFPHSSNFLLNIISFKAHAKTLGVLRFVIASFGDIKRLLQINLHCRQQDYTHTSKKASHQCKIAYYLMEVFSLSITIYTNLM